MVVLLRIDERYTEKTRFVGRVSQVPVVTVRNHDCRHGWNRCVVDRVDIMNRLELDVLAGLFVTVVSVVVGLPVLLGTDAQDLGMPRWALTVVFVAFLAMQVVCMWLADFVSRRIVLAAFGAMVVLGPVLVLGAQSAGWLPILLIFTAALAAHIVGPATTVFVVVGNTVVIACTAWFTAGEVLPVVLVAAIYAALQIASVASILSQERQERTRRQLAAAHVELRTASTLLADSSRTDERLRIARELHDLLGHQLTALSLELEVASHRSVPPASEHVRRAQAIARELLSDVRSTVGELRRHAPDLRITLQRIVNDLPDLEVELEIDDAVHPSEESSAVLIRCVQEIVTNTIRHSGATRLWIEIGTDTDGAITLAARDDGRVATGFAVGHGLTGMSERVEAADGSLRFWVDGAFHVAVTIPNRSTLSKSSAAIV